MFNGLWAKKIGMTEVFRGDLVVPVTVVDIADWYVLQVKTAEADGYSAVKIGHLKNRYAKNGFNAAFLKSLVKFFDHVREVKVDSSKVAPEVGSEVDYASILDEGDAVDVIGTTKGSGFAGVVKRHNFGGGRASHGGSNTLRAPGSISFMRRQGRIIKGKRMAGHMGVVRKTVKGLEIVSIDVNSKAVLVKGAIPGKSGSLVFVRKYKQV